MKNQVSQEKNNNNTQHSIHNTKTVLRISNFYGEHTMLVLVLVVLCTNTY